jgi:MFS family permease
MDKLKIQNEPLRVPDSPPSPLRSPPKSPKPYTPKGTSGGAPFGQVFAHGFLFFIQSVVFTFFNPLFQEIFMDLGIIHPGEEHRTGTNVGYFTGSFFLGKIISDFLWGAVRDAIGDKSCINVTSICIMISLAICGASWSFWSMFIFIFMVGLSSGLFVPGLAFCNWVDINKREKLMVYLYIFAGAGALAGPFIGSQLYSLFETNKLFKTLLCISGMMLFTLICFNYAFSDYDDRALIDVSKYTEMEADEANKLRASGLRLPSLNSEPEHIYVEKISNLDQSETDNYRFISARKKLKGLPTIQIFKNSSSRVLLALVCGIVWCIKLLDAILFPVWSEIPRSKFGLSLTPKQVGVIGVASFPIVAILLIQGHRFIQRLKSSAQMYLTSIGTATIIVMVPLLGRNILNDDYLMAFLIAAAALKDALGIVWLAAWSSMFAKLFPGRNLGNSLSWSFLSGHIILVGLSQVYPALLTTSIEHPYADKYLGEFRVVLFYGMLVVLFVPANIMLLKAQRDLYMEENVLI